jgi:hypothetical protein
MRMTRISSPLARTRGPPCWPLAPPAPALSAEDRDAVLARVMAKFYGAAKPA